ncbi:MAG: GntR family transcriptional regulator [Blastocatellia bacterium]
MKAERSKNSLASEAYLTLRERILRGSLPLGEAVSRRKIAAELGMSMVPVGEALQRLELEGLLESRPRAGTRVKVPTEASVRGHYIVREALEVQAARIFAIAATVQERSELQRLAVRVDTLAAQTNGDRFLYLSLHEKLHRSIAEGTHCQELCNAIEQNQVLASTWLCVPRPAATKPPPHRHQKLVDVLVKGKPESAEAAMRKHIQESLNHTLCRLEAHFQTVEAIPISFARK